MQAAYGTINQTLVMLFNHIMRIEERALIMPGLSIREVHVVEAVCDAEESGANTMTTLAARLRITPGTLSVAVRTLEKKGYLTRGPDAADRRVSRVSPTAPALEVNRKHREFHREMTDSVIGALNASELESLVRALERIDLYFTKKEKEQL